MKIEMPSAVQKIIKTLENAGFEAYIVGGCVRDALLGREPQDWDITTNASPEDVKKCFPRTVDTGIQHGTVTVMMNRVGYEVTTYRIDGKYSDNRHPESVTFTKSLEEDLKRRDFTINAMASNESGIVDIFCGQEDLKNRIIRAVGDPQARFKEDALRIMRCIRFSAQLDFSVEEKTYEAAKLLSGNLSEISRERIREELLKTLVSPHPEKVAEFDEIGAFRFFYPEFTASIPESIRVLKKMPENRILRLCAFFFAAGVDARDSAEIADRVMNELRFDNETRFAVVHLLSYQDFNIPADRRGVRYALNEFKKTYFEELLTLAEAIRGIRLDSVRAFCREIEEKQECTSLKEMALSGKDLISMGIRPGKQMGAILDELLLRVMDAPELNEKEKLADIVRTML